MNWHYDDCVVTADRHVFFKSMAKTIAEKLRDYFGDSFIESCRTMKATE